MPIRYSTVLLESLDKKEDPDVGKNEDRPIVQVEHEDSSRIVDGTPFQSHSYLYCSIQYQVYIINKMVHMDSPLPPRESIINKKLCIKIFKYL